MANEESPIVKDIRLDTAASYLENNEYESMNFEMLFSDLPSSYMLDSEGEENKSINELISEYSVDPQQDISILSFTSSEEYYTIQNHSSSITTDTEYPETILLSFINPPESFYHVRYASEITDAPLDGSLVNTRMRTKKNISGRYLKGVRGKFITVTIPKAVFNYSNPYIRVTRLTVPYQDISFIHPYPILYSSKNKKSHSHVISIGSSIYFKVTQDEIHSCSKHFPNIILTRRKQSELNKMKNIYPFDDSDVSYPFISDSAKNKIARYNLKQSHLDFRLVNLCEQTQEFHDTGIFCRSNALLEAEGVKWRRSST